MNTLPKEVEDTLKELEEHYNNFQVNERGANGYLYFARNKISGADVAIKFYSGEPGEHRHDEPRQLSVIESPYVLPIMDARNISDDWAYFITPRCFEGDLDDLIESKPSVHIAIDVVLGICNGASEIHSLGMLHRDLKPGNIVMHNGMPRIADFGSVRALEDGAEDMTASRHSILFRPPESFDTGRYNIKGDIYQIGIITYQLLGGTLHYDGERFLNAREAKEYAKIDNEVDRSIFIDRIIEKNAKNGKLLCFSTLPPWVDHSARRALYAMINPNPSKRLSSVSDVAAALTHMRSNLSDWKYEGTDAVLTTCDRVIELRDCKNGNYEAFHKKGTNTRRVPGVPVCTLDKMLQYF